MQGFLKPCHTVRKKQEAFNTFIRYLYDAIGQSLLYLRKHFNAERYAFLHHEFRALLNGFLSSFDNEFSTVQPDSKHSFLQFFLCSSRVTVDDKTLPIIKKMGVKDIIIEQYEHIAELLAKIDEQSQQCDKRVLPVIYQLTTDKQLIERLEIYLMKKQISNIYELCCEYPE